MKVGILGAGQLARMLIQSGQKLGLQFTTFAPERSPCVEGLAEQQVAQFLDKEKLQSFFDAHDRITYDWENLSVTTLRGIRECEKKLFPSLYVLEIIANRYRQKKFLNSLGIPTAPHALITEESALMDAVQTLGLPGILKTNQLGYDGKGQKRLRYLGECQTAWAELGRSELEYESWVPFQRELSLIACRSVRGEEKFYPLAENHHVQGVLSETIAPAPVTESMQKVAESYAQKIFQAVDYVGVLVLELFETSAALLVNEMASRVHNSGHWTIEGAETSQFENHLRAGLGLELGGSQALGYTAMRNIIGNWQGTEHIQEVFPDILVHDYLKESRPGRKLGHLTLQGKTHEQLIQNLQTLRSFLAAHGPKEAV
ncbi:5-(carboxyamino)imidazole ribonucleotide synthase [bacterium]|nr:5-(carboxyamino)imidazole ribonucleotide synthase [bacterium]